MNRSPVTLPPLEVDTLPEPLPLTARNLFKTIGPGAILLATSIGGGEWLVGPAVGVQYGSGLFWIATIAISLQVIFNLEASRYTLYTGEPIYSGFMRLRPGSSFWATFYVILTWIQLGLPALAAACGSVLFAAIIGRMPGVGDSQLLVYITYAVMAGTVAMLLFGGTIERMLEYASWLMIVFIFLFLTLVNLLFVPFTHWATTLNGFVSFGYVPEGVDMALLGALAASAGSGGIGNLTITNWIRDKGLGMGSRVGAIPSAFGSSALKLSHTGKIFEIDAENLKRWRVWLKYLTVDQVWLWGLGCFLGLFLNVNLASAIIPPGTDISVIGAGAFQAEYLSKHIWTGFWALALINGFWILFSTHLGNTDILIRTITDIVWVGSPRARNWKGGDIRKIYYLLLMLFTAWGMFAVNWTDAMSLFKILANVAGFVLAFSSIQILIVNTRLLPKELQPPIWRKAALVCCSLFYGAIFVAISFSQLKKLL
jgi:hypothetical protein